MDVLFFKAFRRAMVRVSSTTFILLKIGGRRLKPWLSAGVA
jgi:hypothetical protein